MRIPRNYRLPKDIVEKLDIYSTALGIDRTELITRVLDRYLDEVVEEAAGARVTMIQEMVPVYNVKATKTTKPKIRPKKC